jgi:AcrR family transcriptional regulator
VPDASTRQRLLDATLRAVGREGLAGTSIKDLEEAAGLAAGSGGFYRYFRTKEEALAAAVREQIDRIRTRRPALDEPGDPADARLSLALAVNDSLTNLRTLGPLMAVLAREAGRIPELADEIADELVDGAVRSVEERLLVLLGDVPDAHEQGALILSAIVGYHLTAEYFGGPPGGVGRDRFIATLVDAVRTS